MTIIATPRLVLRPPEDRDIPDIVRGLNNFNVSKWTARIPYPYGPEDAADFLARCAKPEDGTLRLGITIGGQLIGVISYERVRDVTSNVAELGYWLAEPHWGKGYGKEAAFAMTGHAFDQPGHRSLSAGYIKGNEASRRILEGLGFHTLGETLLFSVAHNADMPVVKLILSKVFDWLPMRERRT